MDIQIKLTGTSPLILHNIELSDPENEYAKQIAKISAKRKKTDEDRKELEMLEWFGGLYTDFTNGGIVLPTRCIRKSLINGAKQRKLGKVVERALQFKELSTPILYNGPKDVTALYENKAYHSRESVRIMNARIMRVRPKFPQWEIIADAILLESIMDLDEFEEIAKFSGVAEGLCDNRVNGYGRFNVEVKAFARI